MTQNSSLTETPFVERYDRDIHGRLQPHYPAYCDVRRDLNGYNRLGISNSVPYSAAPLNLSTASACGRALLTLPNDALHSVAAYLTPNDWRMLGQTCRLAKTTTKSVWKRVRMHGFHCAANLVTCIIMGELGDAKELTGLYCRSGVPFYPYMARHGMTYASILWRMGRELRAKYENKRHISHLRSSNRRNGPNHDENSDGEESDAENFVPNNDDGEVASQPSHDEDDGSTSIHAARHVDPYFCDRMDARYQGGYYSSRMTYLEEKSLYWIHKPMLEKNREMQAEWGSGRVAVNETTTQNAHVRVNKHLFAQHVLGRVGIDDELDDLNAPVSLSVDFFHPNRTVHYNIGKEALMLLEDEFITPATLGGVRDFLGRNGGNKTFQRLINLPGFLQTLISAVGIDVYFCPSTNPTSSAVDDTPFLSRSAHGTFGVWTNEDEALFQARKVFQKYRQKLENIFDSGKEEAFDECLAEFWDEFFPATKLIAYYNRQTAVPRMSTLRGFLSNPCPEGVGIVQCEIERIRRVDQSVKGRLFPCYDYRLFIRGRNDQQTNSEVTLMIAKHIGRHRSKRGANNYSICAMDKTSSKNVDASTYDEGNLSTGHELGRLQSNFIGTEFQIFCMNKSKGDNEKMFDFVKPTPQSRSPTRSPDRRGQIPNPACESDSGTIDDESDNNSQSLLRKIGSLPVSLSRNLPPAKWSNWQCRKTRHKIAVADPSHCEDTLGISQSITNSQSDIETEIGAITYTANLLGNRPRVMDVCIPIVEGDEPVEEWRTSNGKDLKMLQCFKALQERLNATTDIDVGDEEDNDHKNFGLLALQNKQPWWNVELGAFVLNFGGRVSVASVKNFQLCSRDNQDHIMLQFGRVQGRHSFTMDFQYPLTATQAFAIAISSMQSKISLA